MASDGRDSAAREVMAAIMRSLPRLHKPLWPDPELSIGRHCGTKQGKHCWEASGPAQEAFEQVAGEIKKLLEDTTSPVPSSSFVVFDIYMIGKTAEVAVPHIMFSCKQKAPRKAAAASVDNSQILDTHPGIHVGHWDYPPHIKNPQPLGSSSDLAELESSPGLLRAYLAAPMPRIDGRYGSRAMPLQLKFLWRGHCLHKATVASVIEIADARFYFAPAHVFADCDNCRDLMRREWGHQDSDSNSECEFGAFGGEDEDADDVDRAESRSDFSATTAVSDSEPDVYVRSDAETFNMDAESKVSSESSNWAASDIFKTHLEASKPQEMEDSLHDATQKQITIRGPIMMSRELDYALIETRRNDFLASSLPLISALDAATIVPGEADVEFTTGSGSFVTGRLSNRPSYIRIPGARTFQMAMVVKLDACLQPGDCGSVIQNSRSRNKYGHVIAGSVESKTAYVIPAMHVLDDLKHVGQLTTGSPTADVMLQGTTTVRLETLPGENEGAPLSSNHRRQECLKRVGGREIVEAERIDTAPPFTECPVDRFEASMQRAGHVTNLREVFASFGPASSSRAWHQYTPSILLSEIELAGGVSRDRRIDFKEGSELSRSPGSKSDWSSSDVDDNMSAISRFSAEPWRPAGIQNSVFGPLEDISPPHRPPAPAPAATDKCDEDGHSNNENNFYLPCEFVGYADCDVKFDLSELDPWIDHIAVHHMNSILPRKAMCWFCDDGGYYSAEEDEGTDLEAQFKSRMVHIAEHFREGSAEADMRPDFHFLDHLHDHGFISERMFQIAKVYADPQRAYLPRRKKSKERCTVRSDVSI